LFIKGKRWGQSGGECKDGSNETMFKYPGPTHGTYQGVGAPTAGLWEYDSPVEFGESEGKDELMSRADGWCCSMEGNVNGKVVMDG
jgi:hypothetical protein